MNILLFGGGWIAETVYVPFLSEMEIVKKIYIYDVDHNLLLNKFKNYPKVHHVSDENLFKLDYGAVCILTPNHLHEEHLAHFTNRDIKILVEKPICINLDQATHLSNLLDRKKAVIYVSSPLRYRKDISIIKRNISSERLGEVYHAEISWLKRKGTPGSPWFTQKKFAGGGVLMDMGPHLLDLFHWMLGEHRLEKCLGSSSSLFFEHGDVFADWHTGVNVSDNHSIDVEDSFFSLLKFNDISLILNLAWVCNIQNDYAQFRIYGAKSSVEVITSLGFSTNTLYKETLIKLCADEKTEQIILDIEDRKEPFRRMLNDFLMNDTCDLPSAEEGLIVMNNIFNLYGTTK